MRQIIGAGTPREAVAGGYDGLFVFLAPEAPILFAILAPENTQVGFVAIFAVFLGGE